MKKKKILVAGGAGYIGSHMVRALAAAGYAPVVFDNLSTGHRRFVPKSVDFVKGDLRSAKDLKTAFKKHRVEAVMHFAASSLVGESVSDPLKYYDNNVWAAVNLLRAMLAAKVNKLIFSSTAATYGEPKRTPIDEDHPKEPTNPYGQTKWAIECMLRDVAHAHGMRYAAMRYFNAAGADASGEIGELHDPETHLIPNVLRSLSKPGGAVTIFGEDYPTKDGTCVRDYIHVSDLAKGHLLALEALDGKIAAESFNLGSGDGYSIREVIAAVEKATGRKVTAKVGPRRPGDPSTLVASAAKARRVLGWKPEKTLQDIVGDAWRWENSNSSKKRT